MGYEGVREGDDFYLDAIGAAGGDSFSDTAAADVFFDGDDAAGAGAEGEDGFVIQRAGKAEVDDVAFDALLGEGLGGGVGGGDHGAKGGEGDPAIG